MDKRKLNKVGCKGYNIDNKIIVSLYIDDGLTMKEIGNKLNISPRTVLDRLQKEGVRKTKRHNVNSDVFGKLTISSCYWAGFIAADGCINKNKVDIELQYDDKKHLEKLCKFSDRDIKLWNRNRFKNDKLYKYSSVSLVSEKIVKDLNDNFNVVPKKSLVLAPPNINTEFISHYIRGFVDGDGCIGWHKHNNKPRLHIISGSLEMIEWVKLNIENSVKTGNPTISNKKENKYEIEYMGNQVYNILDWLYKNSSANTRLDRKYERYKKYLSMR